MKKKAINKIANEILLIPTLEYRDMDHLDFHELSVGQLKRALEEAYAAGKRAAIMQSHGLMNSEGG